MASTVSREVTVAAGPPPIPVRPTARYPTTFRVRHPRAKTGCLTCRSRKKKCDEAKPCCAGCRRRDLDCIWPRGVASGSGVDSRGLGHSRSPSRGCRNDVALCHSQRLSTIGSNPACRLTAESGLLLQHYLSETAVLLPAGSPSPNPFIDYVLPPAQENALLMHSVLAVSGAHLAYKLPGTTGVEIAAGRHYLRAIRGVQDTLASEHMNDKSCI